MKKYNSIFILILLSGFVFAQNDITLEKNNIFGNVRKISIFQTDYEDVFGEIQEKKNELIVEIQFNIEGLCIVHDNGQAALYVKIDDTGSLKNNSRSFKLKSFQGRIKQHGLRTDYLCHFARPADSFLFIGNSLNFIPGSNY